MGWIEICVLFAAGCAGGIVNSLAGGGTNFTFPALLWCGVDPIAASATSTVCLWPGQALGAVAYRERLAEINRRWFWLCLPCVLGGLLGGWLLLITPGHTFNLLVPFLVLSGSLLLGVEPHLRQYFGGRLALDSSRWAQFGCALGIALVAVYGGYYGAGMGILMLAALSLVGVGDLQHVNALKNLLAVTLNLAAIVYFVVVKAVVWWAFVPMVAGACLGGYCGARWAGLVSDKVLRVMVVALGLIVGVVLLVKDVLQQS